MKKLRYLNKHDLRKFRNQIVLGSLFLQNYNNSFTTRENAFYFFDGFIDWLIDVKGKDYFDITTEEEFKYLVEYQKILGGIIID